MYSNIFSSEIRQQNRTLTGLPSVAEQNNYKTFFSRVNKAVIYFIISYTKQDIIFNYFKFFYAIF